MNCIKIPEILLPADRSAMDKWAVNACDQFTSDLKYWQDVESKTSGKPSTFNLILPEIYLKDNPQARIQKINRAMQEYLESGVFEKFTGLVLVERTTHSGTRTGIVLAVDLEDYSFVKGYKALIRSTEATITERIPPRVAVRRNAPIELPHVMLLYDDEKKKTVESCKRGRKLYDFDLMMDGGHVTGYEIANPQEVVESLYSLADVGRCNTRYGINDSILFAVGDGNHSLATAKTLWDEIKVNLSESQRSVHPARYALCEAVNIYDGALTFEPIHRYVICDDCEKFVNGLHTAGGKSAYIAVNGQKTRIDFSDDIPDGIRAIDNYIAKFIAENGGQVDYIHGEDQIISYTENSGVGIILPPICKDDFFRLIVNGGNLPKKTFSMGEGNEKRYYIEARKIK